jgi:hypothetical protein
VSLPVLETVIHFHRAENRSHPCGFWNAEGPCDGCRDGIPARVECWIQVQDERQRYPVALFRVTECALRDNPWLAYDDGLHVGTMITTWRKGAVLSGRQFIRKEKGDSLPSVPEVQSTLAVVRQLWAGRTKNLPPPAPKIFAPNPDDDIPGVGPPELDGSPEGDSNGQ